MINCIKLPDHIDPNIIIENKIIEEYGSFCPFCGENHSIWDYANTRSFLKQGIDSKSLCRTWVGIRDGDKKSESIFDLFKKRYHWKRLLAKCYTCGCSWELPCFPTDILNQEQINRILSKILWNSNSKNTKTLPFTGVYWNDIWQKINKSKTIFR